MTNADKFRHLFGIYATELWAMPENDFLEWLNADAQDMPTVERKTGEWILKSESGCIIECSSCGERMTVLGDENPNFCNFCPYCGSYNRDKSDDIPIEYFENGGK